MQITLDEGAERSLKRLLAHFGQHASRNGQPWPTEETIVAHALYRLEDQEIRKPGEAKGDDG